MSSVIENFSSFRAAARAAIIEAGGEPVMVNEDFPSLATSSRNACLDAVDTSDIYLGIIGARGGWKAPSGKTVVEEEYERAKLKRLPTIFLLQKVERDTEAERFARRISDYVDGTLRRMFNTPEELHREVLRALVPHIAPEVKVTQPPQELLEAFHEAHRQTSGSPVLRVVIAPERREEVIDPMKMGSPEFRHLLLELGHRGDVALLDYAHGKSHKLKGDLLTIEECGEGGARIPTVGLTLSESGMLTGDTQLERRRERGGLSAAFVVPIEDVENDLRSVLAFYATLLDKLDEFKRHQRFFYNVGLLGLSYQRLERNPQPRSSHTMAMRSGDAPVVAYKEPRMITREALRQSEEEIERAVTLLVRNSGS